MSKVTLHWISAINWISGIILITVVVIPVIRINTEINLIFFGGALIFYVWSYLEYFYVQTRRFLQILYWFITKSIAITQYDMFCRRTHSVVLPTPHLLSLFLAQQLSPLWKSQIAHLDMHHLVFGINFPICFNSIFLGRKKVVLALLYSN